MTGKIFYLQNYLFSKTRFLFVNVAWLTHLLPNNTIQFNNFDLKKKTIYQWTSVCLEHSWKVMGFKKQTETFETAFIMVNKSEKCGKQLDISQEQNFQDK